MTSVAVCSLVAFGTLGVVAAAPASAATTITLAGVQTNGQVGVPQYLSITAAVDGGACGPVLPPAVTILGSTTGSTQTIGTATFAQCVGNAFQYTFQWVPTSAVPLYISANLSGTSSNAIRSAIAPVPTTTRITAANTVAVGQPTMITASVTANNGSQASPQGFVQFGVLGGGTIGSPVPLNNAVPSTAQIQWIPSVLGTVNLTATYTPATVNGVINTTCGASCTSAPDQVQVTSTGVNVFIANPPGFSTGLPSTLTAVVSVVPPSGVVTFTINGAILATNVPVQSNGQAQATWTPPAPGNYTLAVRWVGNGGVTGTAQDNLAVGAAPAQSDVISLAPQGQGAWSPVGLYTLANGTTVTFVTSTASGSPVTLAESGPCNLSGATLVVDAGTGQCRLTASSRGGNGYGPATAIYTINLAPGTQTPLAAPRASGRVNRGSTVTLITGRNNQTNAGQDLNWRVTSGANRCRLVYPNNGSVRLRAVRNGNCNVRIVAPAVAGQWNRLVLNRTYRVR